VAQSGSALALGARGRWFESSRTDQSTEGDEVGEKFSIYAGEPVDRLLTLAGRDNRSGRINDCASRYLDVVDEELARLDFTRDEWCAICDANNGSMIGGFGDDISWRMAWANVADTPELGEKWDIDLASLVGRMQGLTLAQKAAVAEVIQRFWERVSLPTDDALREAGALSDDKTPHAGVRNEGGRIVP
jgi:hypothetical protein